jgi:hypothetical protein
MMAIESTTANGAGLAVCWILLENGTLGGGVATVGHSLLSRLEDPLAAGACPAPRLVLLDDLR